LAISPIEAVSSSVAAATVSTLVEARVDAAVFLRRGPPCLTLRDGEDIGV
jgi:hypothetical protein